MTKPSVKDFLTYTSWFLTGAGLLCALFTLQKYIVKVSFDWKGYYIPFLFGGISGLSFGVWKNLFQKKNLELLDSESRYQQLYSSTPVMMQSLDPEGRLTDVNNYWLDALGYEKNEVLGKKLFHFMTEASKVHAENTVFPDFLREGILKDIPFELIKKNGQVINILLSAIGERDEQGKVIRAQAVAVDFTERKKNEEEVQKLAYYDSLTGLPNRTLFQDRLNQALAQAQRNKRRVAVFFLDLDRFKAINDTLGHAVGDMVLKSVAHSLTECVRESDTVARLGGDEFVIILPSFESDQHLTLFAERILETLDRPFKFGEKELFSNASIGIVTYPQDGEDVETLLSNADIAMYAAKDRGRNTFQFFSKEMNAQAVEKLALETRLRRALLKNELFLAYQPQVDLDAGKITGIEALLRWRHGENEMIPPAKFIPVAEETGLIVPIGEWVLHTACSQLKAWQDAGLPPVRLAVNLSSRQFKQPDFIDMIDRVLLEKNVDPSWLELELTESLFLENAEENIMTLTDLRVRGIGLAIDDFGTGYSSLNYLKHFPINRIKIAQDFVRDIPNDPDDAAIVEAIIAMAHSLGLKVLAEGVEKITQLNFLGNRKCTEMQGYYFARPMIAEKLTGFFQESMQRESFCLFEG